MKKILISITAVSALAAATLPAVASAQSLYDRRGDLERRIDMGVRTGQLTRGEAYRLRGELRSTARLESDYRRGGLNGWERADLDRRYDNISTQVRYERHDDQYGYGRDPGPRRW